MTAPTGNPPARAARHFILGTAGHVDHGKTELVRALTGHDTDRLKEEKERGISIELGFAPLPLSDDVFLGVIDVPGHERFVRQMVAGAGAIDLALLLVAADEGVMPQTQEHLEVLRSLDVRAGVVVISKSDLASADTLPLLREEITALVKGTFLEGAPVVPVSARSGDGLTDLCATLLALARALEPRDTTGPFRLAVDRVFHQKGIGVVVTGSGYSGRVGVGDELDLLPRGTRVRVRDVQSFGAHLDHGTAGERLALALHGVKLDGLARGDWLVTPGRFTVSRALDARVWIARYDDLELKNRERVRVHHGARELLARVVLLEGDVLHAGETGLAQIRTESPVVAGAGDRVVLRRYSPARVIGGGTVIDPAPEAHRRFEPAAIERLQQRESGDPVAVLEKAIERADLAGVPEAEADAGGLSALAREGVVVVVAGRAFHAAVLDALAERAIETAVAHTTRFPLQWGIDKEELRRRLVFPHPSAVFNRVLEHLARSHPVFVREDRVRAGTPAHELPPPLRTAVDRLARAIRDAGVTFLSRGEAERSWGGDRFADAVQYLRDRGDVVEVGDGLMDAGALGRCLAVLRSHFAARPDLAVGDLKGALGISRKHAIPLLEYLDARRITARSGDHRVRGPAFPVDEAP